MNHFADLDHQEPRQRRRERAEPDESASFGYVARKVFWAIFLAVVLCVFMLRFMAAFAGVRQSPFVDDAGIVLVAFTVAYALDQLTR